MSKIEIVTETTEEVTLPTCEELSDVHGDADDFFKIVDSESDPSWRHGSYESTVFLRLADDTYWQACYNVSTDGETHGLRDGDADISRVYPHRVMATVYKSRPQTDD